MMRTSWSRWATVGLIVTVLGGSIAAAGAATPSGSNTGDNSIPPPPNVAPPSDPNALVQIADASGNVRKGADGKPVLVRLGALGGAAPTLSPQQAGAMNPNLLNPNLLNPNPMDPNQAVPAPAGQTTLGYTQDDDGNWVLTQTVTLQPGDLQVPQVPPTP